MTRWAIALIISLSCGVASAQNVSLRFAANDDCVSATESRAVEINVSASAGPIVGGQFFFSVDPTRVRVIGLEPVPPFERVIFERIDPATGVIDFAVHVPFQPAHPGVAGPATMARVIVEPLDAACSISSLIWRENAVTRNRLSLAGGIIVEPDVESRQMLINADPFELVCPPDMMVRVPMDTAALVEFAVPETLETCGGIVPVVCSATAPPGTDVSADVLPMGGLFPFGESTVRCATGLDCGAPSRCEFRVTVAALGGPDDPDPDEPGGTVDLALTLTASRSDLARGEEVVFTVVGSNDGTVDVAEAILFLDFGSFLDVASSTDQPELTSNTALWRLGPFAAGSSRLRSLTAVLDPAIVPQRVPQLTIAARVVHNGAAGVDVDPANDRAEVRLGVVADTPVDQLGPQVRPPLPGEPVGACDPAVCGACGSGAGCAASFIGLTLLSVRRRRRPAPR